jgi:hypothetical protein
MPFIKVALKDAKEDVVVPEGPYDLRIISASQEESKKGNAMIVCGIAIESQDHPNSALLRHYIMLPGEDVDEDDKDAVRMEGMRLRDMRRFLDVFGIKFEAEGFDTDDLEGSNGNCMVVQRAMRNEDGTDGEMVNALRLPKFKDEVEEEKPKASRSTASRPAGRRR